MAHPLKKSEHKREEPKLGEPKLVQIDGPSEIPIAQKLVGESVADTLIRARQQLGHDLRSIAGVLCIRYSYLDAIERGQYENLPGPAYAIGFVRTYADYLGLDGDQIVDRFKSEVAGLDSQTKLHFPTPAPEGKMPGGAVFLVAALLFAGAYGIWFYLSNNGENLGDLVAPVPEQLQELVEGATTAAEDARPAAPEPAAPASATPQAPVEPARPASERTETGAAAPAATQPGRAAASDAPPAAATPMTSTAAPQGEAPAAPQAGGATPVQAPPAAAPQGSSVPQDGMGRRPQNAQAAGSALAPATAAADQQAAVPPAGAAAGETSAAESPASEAASPSEPYSIPAAPESDTSATAFLRNHQPTVYGEENGDARVVLKANQDAWVQVRDREGNLLLTRVLRVGDSYKVPNQADLTLLTGNAGGLEISVDGSALPALGPVGAVRRNIPLDPEALSGGAGRQP
ncbi:MAG: DUF4115 domain-containing protein [Kiloniellaceae bacterium]|nr:DUF4115 domain-containing protein [Kiloniellaceae bacterium]